MQTFSQKLTAGQRVHFGTSGQVCFIQAADQGENITVEFEVGGVTMYQVANVGQSFKGRPAGGFSGVAMTAAGVDTNVTFVLTDGDIDLQFLQSTVQVTNPVGSPVPVAVQGTVTVSGATLTATNVGINNDSAHPVPVSLVSEPGAPLAVTPTQASSVSDVAPTAVPAFTSGSPNQVHFRAAGACRALRVSNPLASTGNLYVGGAGVTPTNAVIVLQPGDVWNETDAPQIDWYATSDTGATVNVQVIA
ncbi:hypothetical protein WS86_24490 [Burkholderia savannae]|uniref:hypothetical protein n=1 Tax=Burkholderia savannae TaxID=1637837 RepID=UPI0007569619|nr:hypothetical protein [Burkholderia savannae]AOJ83789.1 hypothetical protein WS86_24490 [Burkholderia savannae]